MPGHGCGRPALSAAKAAETQLAGPLVSISDLARSGALTFVDRDAARPGDVIVPGGFEAVVVEDTGEQSVGNLSVLRCDPDVLDPYFLACFLRSETNRRQAAGTLGDLPARCPTRPRATHVTVGAASIW